MTYPDPVDWPTCGGWWWFRHLRKRCRIWDCWIIALVNYDATMICVNGVWTDENKLSGNDDFYTIQFVGPIPEPVERKL